MSLREKVDNIFHDRIHAKRARTSNTNCKEFVRKCLPFKASNLYGEWVYPHNEEEPAMYVVYSWGTHFPLYIWEPVERAWLGNTTGSTTSTQQHRWDARPDSGVLPIDLDTMLEIIHEGARPVWNRILEEEK